MDEFFTSVGNWWNGRGFGVRDDYYETETIGYETKRVSEITGYRDELDRTQTYRVQAGTRTILAGYQPFGDRGTALALTAWYLALRRAAGIGAGNADAVYRQVLADVQTGGPPGAGWLPPDAGRLLSQVIAEEAGCLRFIRHSDLRRVTSFHDPERTRASPFPFWWL